MKLITQDVRIFLNTSGVGNTSNETYGSTTFKRIIGVWYEVKDGFESLANFKKIEVGIGPENPTQDITVDCEGNGKSVQITIRLCVLVEE